MGLFDGVTGKVPVATTIYHEGDPWLWIIRQGDATSIFMRLTMTPSFHATFVLPCTSARQPPAFWQTFSSIMGVEPPTTRASHVPTQPFYPDTAKHDTIAICDPTTRGDEENDTSQDVDGSSQGK